MFWSSKKPDVAEAVVSKPAVAKSEYCPQPKAVSVLVSTEKQQSYEALAASIGFDPPELVLAQLLLFFQEQEIRTYDLNQVDFWLQTKCPHDKVWCWHPLRAKDAYPAEPRYSWELHPTNGWDHGYYNSAKNERSYCAPYSRLVPHRVLERIALLERKFNTDQSAHPLAGQHGIPASTAAPKIKFFVTDFAVPKPDPFIMVCPADMSHLDGNLQDFLLIFDAWDEPGFGK